MQKQSIKPLKPEKNRKMPYQQTAGQGIEYRCKL